MQSHPDKLAALYPFAVNFLYQFPVSSVLSPEALVPSPTVGLLAEPPAFGFSRARKIHSRPNR
jgi:hypothetical protein